MNLIEKIDTIFKLKKELEEAGIIDCIDLYKHGESVQLDSDNIDNFINLANGEKIKISERGSSDYPYEAIFNDGGYTFFAILSEDKKIELEKLINEREAEESANGIKTI